MPRRDPETDLVHADRDYHDLLLRVESQGAQIERLAETADVMAAHYGELAKQIERLTPVIEEILAARARRARLRDEVGLHVLKGAVWAAVVVFGVVVWQGFVGYVGRDVEQRKPLPQTSGAPK